MARDWHTASYATSFCCRLVYSPLIVSKKMFHGIFDGGRYSLLGLIHFTRRDCCLRKLAVGPLRQVSLERTVLMPFAILKDFVSQRRRIRHTCPRCIKAQVGELSVQALLL